MRTLYCTIPLLLLTGALLAQPLYVVPSDVETRWASPENPAGEKGKAAQANAGRKGRPAVPIQPGESLTLAEVRGRSGTVRRIWATINDRSPEMLRSLRIDMFWDGAAKPAVSAPFGDFFGTGIGQMATFQSAAFSSPEGRSFNCYIPMPFRSGMKIVVTNEGSKPLAMLFYDVDYTLGDRHDNNVMYFHAHWRRENPTTLQRDYEILPRTAGRGRFLGTNIGVIANRRLYATSWWGEGEVKVYLDGDATLPTLSGTGTEDYIGTGWGQGQYAHLYQGCHLADGRNMRYCFYRYHIPDPVYFHKDIRVTIQQIGYMGEEAMGTVYKAGQPPVYKTGAGKVRKEMLEGGLFERQDDWSSCAYFYLDQPVNSLPALPPASERVNGL